MGVLEVFFVEDIMFKFLEGAVGGSGMGPRDLPYNICQPYPSVWDPLNQCRGTSKVRAAPPSLTSLSVRIQMQRGTLCIYICVDVIANVKLPFCRSTTVSMSTQLSSDIDADAVSTSASSFSSSPFASPLPVALIDPQ
ncbi:hypothetical protein GW17_00017124 [Ensete ventricosum]|nr:hypothetical protein GW17_00017124 [Ensete ventricosum]